MGPILSVINHIVPFDQMPYHWLRDTEHIDCTKLSVSYEKVEFICEYKEILAGVRIV